MDSQIEGGEGQASWWNECSFGISLGGEQDEEAAHHPLNWKLGIGRFTLQKLGVSPRRGTGGLEDACPGWPNEHCSVNALIQSRNGAIENAQEACFSRRSQGSRLSGMQYTPNDRVRREHAFQSPSPSSPLHELPSTFSISANVACPFVVLVVFLAVICLCLVDFARAPSLSHHALPNYAAALSTRIGHSLRSSETIRSTEAKAISPR